MIRGGERKQADLFVTGGSEAGIHPRDDILNGALTDGAVDDAGVAKTAATGAAAHDLDGDAILDHFEVGDEEGGGRRGEFGYDALMDHLRNAIEGGGDGGDRPICMICDFVKRGDVDAGDVGKAF